MPAIEKQYYAFISYKRDDQKWAEWLQEKLEHYKLPTNLNGRSDLPKEIRPVFRDKSELAAGVLADEIQKALDNSKYLIVICSPHSAKSEWVNKEVQAFIDSGRTDKIIPFIIEGMPNSGNDETECFPKAIRELPAEDELLGVNINEMGRDAAAVKVVAQMFGLRFDDLWQRHEREKRRKRKILKTAITAAAIIVIGIAGWIWYQNVQLKKKDWKMKESQSRLVSEMIKMNVKNDSYLARMAALEVLPKDVSNPTDRPYTAEAECALRKTYEYNSAIYHISDWEYVDNAFFRADGSQIIMVFAHTNPEVRHYDVNSFAEIKSYGVNDNFGFNGVDVSADGKIVVKECADGKFIIYNIESGEKIQTLDDRTNELFLCFSPNGDKYVTISEEDTLKVYNTFTGELSFKLEEPDQSLDVASFSRDGKYLAYASSENLYEGFCLNNGNSKKYSANTIRIINVKSGSEINSWSGHNNIISHVSFSNDNKRIVTSSYDGTVKVWDVMTGQEISTSEKVGQSLYYASFSHDGKYVVSASDDGSVTVWDSNTGKEAYSLLGHKSDCRITEFSPDGNKIISLARDKEVRIWDIEQKTNTIFKANHVIGKENVDISPDNKHIAAVYDDTTIVVLDAKTGVIESKIKTHNPPEHIVAFSKDGKKIIFNDKALELKIWDIDNNKEVGVLSGHDYRAYTVAFSPDGEKVVASIQNARMALWDVKNGDNPVVAKFNNSLATAEFGPDEKRIFLGMYNNGINVLTVDSCKLDREIGWAHKNVINSLAFNPNGKRMVSASSDFTLKIWGLSSYRMIKAFKGHEGAVNHAVYSHDGNYIASASADKTVRVWDVKNGGCVGVFEGHTDEVTFVSFTEDDRHIISASRDSTIRLWDFPPLQELIDSTRECFKNRPLTDEEKKMYYLE